VNRDGLIGFILSNDAGDKYEDAPGARMSQEDVD
jgi:hypothetical protein